MTDSNHRAWVHSVKAHGWADLLGTALDALEPLGPLGAQLIWVAQPALGLFFRHDTLDSLARALEEPGGVKAWRRLLNEESTSDEEA